MKQIPVCSLEETGELGLKLASLYKTGNADYIKR